MARAFGLSVESDFVTDLDVADLRARYDAQLRTVVPDPLPEGLRVERDGPLVRFTGYGNGGGIGYRDLGGIQGAELDELIARQVRAFAERGEAFEWKLHGHDRPADLSERLLAQGFVPEDLETVVIAPVAEVAGEVSLARPRDAARGDPSRGSRTDRRDGGRRSGTTIGPDGSPTASRPSGRPTRMR